MIQISGAGAVIAQMVGLGFEDQNVPTRTTTRTLPFTRPCPCAAGKKLERIGHWQKQNLDPILIVVVIA